MESCRKSGVHPLDTDAQLRVRAHLHLVEALAWEQFRLCGRTMPLEELLGEAQLALTYGAGRFDEAREVPFGAYATMVIRHWLVQAVNVWRRGGRLAHTRLPDLPGRGERRALPVDEPCHRTRDPSKEVADRELLERIRRTMPPRWFVALQLYYAHEYTLEEIGDLFGVSRERVRKLIAKAVEWARRHCPGEEKTGTGATPAACSTSSGWHELLSRRTG